MVRPVKAVEQRLLSKVSKMYYDEGLKQEEISDRLQLSRPKVSRLLQQARDMGIVRITVLPPPGIYSDLESELETRYGLVEVYVVATAAPNSQEAVTRELGVAAAQYLQRTLSKDDIVGITWGSTLSAMVSAMQPIELDGIQVVQLNGGLGRPESEIHSTDIALRLARMLDARLNLLPAPGIVNNHQIKQLYLSDSHVQRTMAMYPEVDIAFVGIGSPTPNSVIVRDGSIISQGELERMGSLGAAGDIALRFFDADGKPLKSDIDERVIGITLEELARIKRVVGVAGGPEKVAAVRGAVRGRLLNVLITDEATARHIL